MEQHKMNNHEWEASTAMIMNGVSGEGNGSGGSGDGSGEGNTE